MKTIKELFNKSVLELREWEKSRKEHERDSGSETLSPRPDWPAACFLVNNVLLESNHIHSYTYCLWLFSLVVTETMWPTKPFLCITWPFATTTTKRSLASPGPMVPGWAGGPALLIHQNAWPDSRQWTTEGMRRAKKILKSYKDVPMSLSQWGKVGGPITTGAALLSWQRESLPQDLTAHTEEPRQGGKQRWEGTARSSKENYSRTSTLFPSTSLLCTESCPTPQQNPHWIHVEALTPNVLVFGDGALGRWLGLDEVMKVRPSRWGFVPL